MRLDDAVAAVLARGRAVTLAGLLLLAALAWWSLLRLTAPGAMDATSPADMAWMAAARAWTLADAALAALMWATMMTAMMLPSASPVVLVFVGLNRARRGAGAAPVLDTGLFVLGYLAVWSGFSLAAAGGQWGLHAAAALASDTLRVTPAVGGPLLVAAGLYQITPLKTVCLARCRSPLSFLMAGWRPGRRGALALGVRHGLYCLGCCWALMTLLFVGGAMNLVWAAALGGFVLLEKLVPAGRAVSWLSGLALVAWGLWTLRSLA